MVRNTGTFCSPKALLSLNTEIIKNAMEISPRLVMQYVYSKRRANCSQGLRGCLLCSNVVTKSLWSALFWIPDAFVRVRDILTFKKQLDTQTNLSSTKCR